MRAVRFIIPWNERLDSVIGDVVAETLPGPYLVKPAQRGVCSICDSEPPVPPRPWFYDCGYPLQSVDAVTECYLATFRLASFNLRPVLWLASGQIVRVLHVTVFIFTSPCGNYGGLRAMGAIRVES